MEIIILLLVVSLLSFLVFKCMDIGMEKEKLVKMQYRLVKIDEFGKILFVDRDFGTERLQFGIDLTPRLKLLKTKEEHQDNFDWIVMTFAT